MRRSQTNGRKRFSGIDMTSLMDLTFILLITFIITMPSVENNISVKLPQGSADTVRDDKKANTVTLDAKGGVFLNNHQTTLEELETSLGLLAADDPQTSVLIRADTSLDYGEVMKVMRLLYKARITRMGLVTLAD